MSLKETSVGGGTTSTPVSVVTVTTDCSEVGGNSGFSLEVRRLLPIRTVRRHGRCFLRLRGIGPHGRISSKRDAFSKASVAIKRGTGRSGIGRAVYYKIFPQLNATAATVFGTVFVWLRDQVLQTSVTFSPASGTR